MRIFFLFVTLILTLGANTQLYPKRSCELFNNLKHTANRGSVTLDIHRTYEMLDHHKGQYLLKVEGATPSQRWVDDDCLSLRPLRGTPLYGQTASTIPAKKPKPSVPEAQDRSTENLLALSWHNAFCETHRNKKECKRGLFAKKRGDDTFVLHGLWPQPRNRVYCNVPKRDIIADKHKQWHKLPEPKLTEQTKEALAQVMPGLSSNLHRHEWIKHGTCYGTDAEQYFSDAIALTQAVRQSKIADFFRKFSGKRVTLQRVRELFDEAYGKDSGKSVELRCNRGMIIELWLHLGSGDTLSEMLRNGKRVRSRCNRGIIDRAGY